MFLIGDFDIGNLGFRNRGVTSYADKVLTHLKNSAVHVQQGMSDEEFSRAEVEFVFASRLILKAPFPSVCWWVSVFPTGGLPELHDNSCAPPLTFPSLPYRIIAAIFFTVRLTYRFFSSGKNRRCLRSPTRKTSSINTPFERNSV